MVESCIWGEGSEWNHLSIVTIVVIDMRPLTLHRFLGGSSGTNGTLCIRGVKQDYDDWDMKGWSGTDMFGYMKQIRWIRLPSFLSREQLT
jgi:choline dehydrogenase-like flavoprotein